MAAVPRPETIRTSSTCADERPHAQRPAVYPPRQRLRRQAGDAPAAGLSDAKRAVPQQQDTQRQQAADGRGKRCAKRRTRDFEAGTPDCDALAEEQDLPGGVDEEEVEHHVQHTDQHADKAGRQGVAGGRSMAVYIPMAIVKGRAADQMAK